MNKHLKPGVAVDVRGASDEVKEQVMVSFVRAGAIRGIDDRMPNFICWGSSTKRVYFFGGDSVIDYELISINQALGRESEVEKNELPAVGDIVEYCNKKEGLERICVDDWKNGDHLECLAIRKVGMDEVPVFFNLRDMTASCLISGFYRPLKTEKEKFVERLVLIMNDNTNATFTEISGILYDKGLRFTE